MTEQEKKQNYEIFSLHQDVSTLEECERQPDPPYLKQEKEEVKE